jgi:hypothetical protein
MYMLRTRLKLNLAFATFSAMAVMPLSSRVLFAQAAPATRPYQSNEHVILHRSEPNGVMKGFPPDKRQLVTLDNWESALGDSLLAGKGSSKELPKFRWSLRHMREIFPTQVIRRGPGPVSVFPVRRIAMDLDELRFEDVRGNERSVKEWLEYSNTDAILVIHKGATVYEEYFDGMTEDTTHRIHSGSKSISATVIANLLESKKLTLNGMITDYIPELRGTGYDGATVVSLRQACNSFSLAGAAQIGECRPDDAGSSEFVERAVAGFLGRLEPVAEV